MNVLTNLGLDWPVLGLYLLPPLAFSVVLFLLRRVSKGRSRLRRIGTGTVMLCVFAVGSTVELSPAHSSRFEEMMLAAVLFTLVLVLDWRLTAHRGD